MDRVKRAIVGLFLLWIPFTLTTLISIPVALWAVFQEDEESYAKGLLRQQDRLAAALFGWGGRNTISAECGSRQKNCRLCKLICGLLSWIQPGHCEGAAKHEGLA